ncbi:MFS general substrate transporter [Xylariaceae sp. FL1272]|nr:MFS general substrate transporter [Xylariaceae sp. FL1272]
MSNIHENVECPKRDLSPVKTRIYVHPTGKDEASGELVRSIDQTATQSVWTSNNDSERPSHWPSHRKWVATIILSAFATLQPLVETMLAPAKEEISQDLHIKQPYGWSLVNSVILIGIGLSPLLLAPLSELYGRKPVIVAAGIVLIVWNTACGASTTLGQLLSFRLLSGFGACVADAVSGGVLRDLWAAEERGRAFAVYSVVPLLGFALGPILGAVISEATSWRWTFWTTSLLTALVTTIAVAFLNETYEPRIEQQKTLMNLSPQHPIVLSSSPLPLFDTIGKNLQRPFRMLGTQPIIQLLAVYMAFLYGILFSVLFIYPLVWRQDYHQAVIASSLNYISLATGLVFGANIAGHLNDYIYCRIKAHMKGAERAEFRVPPMIIGTVLVPIGLLWWGWSAQARLHWALPNIGSFILGTGVYICSGCVNMYTVDAYDKFAASAISTNLVTRSIAAAFFPLFAPYLFDSLGLGLGVTVLASTFVLLGTGVVCMLWFFGEHLRAQSSFCVSANTRNI